MSDQPNAQASAFDNINRNLATLNLNISDSRKWCLLSAAVLGLLLFALTVAVWIGMLALSNQQEPEITQQEAVSKGHAEFVQYEDGGKSFRWLPSPQYFERTIEGRDKKIERLEWELETRDGTVKTLEEQIAKVSGLNKGLSESLEQARTDLENGGQAYQRLEHEYQTFRQNVKDTAKKLKHKDIPLDARDISLLEDIEDAAEEPDDKGDTDRPKKYRKWYVPWSWGRDKKPGN